MISHISEGKKDGRDQRKYTSCGKTLKTLSLEIGIMGSKEVVPVKKQVPWFIEKQKNKDMEAFEHHYKGKDREEPIKDLFLPAVYRAGQIIYSADTSDQTAYNAVRDIINWNLPDKIINNQRKQEFSVFNHIEQLVLKQTIINDAISKPDNDDIIDVTPESET